MLTPNRDASAYTYYYPNQYIRDLSGSYSYRAQTFDWSTWYGNGTYISNLYMYVHISSPTAGDAYQTWTLGFLAVELNGLFRSSTTYEPWYVQTYSSGPRWMGFAGWGGLVTATNSDPIRPSSAVCGDDSAHQKCGFPTNSFYYGALLQNVLRRHYSYITNGQQQYPTYYW